MRAEAGGEEPVTPVAPTSKTFQDLGVSADICEALAAEGIITTFPIQTLALPIGLGGHDIIGQARTGTGKTLAFGIPLLERLRGFPASRPYAPGALVVVPTRELAIQVAGDLTTAGSRIGTRVLTLYGGRAYEPQIESLRAGVDVVVGTPGRLLDLARQGHLRLSDVKTLVLDEADKMLDLGFLPDVERILELIPGERQTMLFSATMPGEVVTLARRYLRQPTNVRTGQDDEAADVALTTQHVFRAHQLDKIEMLARVLQAEGRGLTMVFSRTKRTADQVAAALATRGFAAAAVHGDLGQAQRERALRAFRHGKVDVLVATDVAARGLDVEDVTHVINYECPEDDKAYIHRVGRTGRAGRAGVAVTFVDWRDLQRWKLIDEALGLAIPEPPETYSTSDHLYETLAIPAGISGSLPRNRRRRQGLEAEEIEDLGETGRTRSHAPHARGRERTRPPRVRRRTWNGKPGHEPAGEASRGSGTAAPAVTGDGGSEQAPRRRRRRRGGRSRSARGGRPEPG
ncbi:MAG: DEAD/DEAH box helicase [Nocardiopsaceae bacterium]|jgi:superfamily II DNA/RNA helicase|nr:DEAD/DEAH box helicase [Nocardiopsaceae bacterium]